MKKFAQMATLLFILFICNVAHAENGYAVVTASNDAEENELLVYDPDGNLIQSIATQGKGGVGPHIVGGGVAKFGPYVAVINYNSKTVSLFKQQGGSFKFLQQLTVMTNPVSVAFGHNHLYVLGTTTIESHRMNGDLINEKPDGSSELLVGDGSAAQVGVLGSQLIISERSSMIELVDLRNGAVTENISPVQLPPPPKNDTPVGLVTRGNTAFVTIAHSNLVGLVREGRLVKVISSENQNAPCWLTLSGNSLYCANTPSKSISRYEVSENNINLAKLVAAKTQGEPTDIDALDDVLAAIEFGEGGASLSQYEIEEDGDLELINTVRVAANANGIVVIKWPFSNMRN